MTNPNDEYYNAKKKKIFNVLKHQNLKVSRVAVAGSRARQEQHPGSDMDIIFSVSGDPSRDDFYPELQDVVKANYPEASVYPGENNNVIHLDLPNEAKVELVLRTEAEFEKQHGKDKAYRIENL
ncbi:MAG: nucleotidyltransferase domain-containing protein [Candidatus Odinarchaeota archaeon]